MTNGGYSDPHCTPLPPKAFFSRMDNYYLLIRPKFRFNFFRHTSEIYIKPIVVAKWPKLPMFQIQVQTDA